MSNSNGPMKKSMRLLKYNKNEGNKQEKFSVYLGNQNPTNKATFLKNGLRGCFSFVEVSNAKEFFTYHRKLMPLGNISLDKKLSDEFKEDGVKFDNYSHAAILNLTDWHEVLRPNVKSRLIIDLDGKIELENDIITEADKKRIVDKIAQYQGIIDFISKSILKYSEEKEFNLHTRYIVCESRRKSSTKGKTSIKLSQHVIFPEVIFADMDTMKNFMCRIKVDYMKENNVACNCRAGIVSCKCCKELDPLDLNVYGNMNFRIPLTVADKFMLRDSSLNEEQNTEDNSEMHYFISDDIIPYMDYTFRTCQRETFTGQDSIYGVHQLLVKHTDPKITPGENTETNEDILDALMTTDYIMKVKKVVELFDSNDAHKFYNKLSFDKHEKPMDDECWAWLLVQYIPNLEEIGVYDYTKIELVENRASTVSTDTEFTPITTIKTHPIVHQGTETKAGKPYTMNEKYANIDNVKKCLNYLAEKHPQYYDDRIEWFKIGAMLGHLRRHFTSIDKDVEAAHIVTLYNDFSKKSSRYKDKDDVLKQLDGSSTSLAFYDGHLKINSLYNIIYKLDVKEYYKIIPKIKQYHSYTDFSGARFNTRTDFIMNIRKCILQGPKSFIFRLKNTAYKSKKSVFKYNYEEYSLTEATTMMNKVKVFIKNTKDPKDEKAKFKAYKLSNALCDFVTTIYSGFTCDPSQNFGTLRDDDDDLIFNTFREIPVTPVALSSDDKQVLTVNKFIEDLCGKERNPKSYIEYYDYLLNYMSWIFANKRSSGVMILLIGDKGAGKTLMSNFIAKLFTREYSCNTKNDTFFNNKFNSQIKGKLIITIDEFKLLDMDSFKDLVEKKDVRELTQKGKDTVTVETFENYIATSNTLDQKLSCQDRRCCVINSGYKIDSTYAAEVLVPILHDAAFQNKFRNILIERWKNIKDTFDISKFPVSKLKMQMTENSMNDFQRYLVKEYYYLKSDTKIIFSDFKKDYEAFAEQEKPLSSAAFKKIYSRYDGLSKYTTTVNKKSKNILSIKNIDRLYGTFIEKKDIPKLCIEYNKEYSGVSDPNGFKKFETEYNAQKAQQHKAVTEEVASDVEIDLLDKLLCPKNKRESEKSRFSKLVSTFCNIMKSYDETKLTKEQIELLDNVTKIQF
jgi:hypothetical protein